MAPTADHDPLQSVDFYELLSISATASESEIRRAYRKTSLLYHPDKVTPTPETLEKFQLLQSAISTLTDPAEKAKYDQSREAKQRRKAETEALEGRRRKMKEDLENRETSAFNAGGGQRGSINGTKRSWSERDLEIKRIAEENRRKREETVAKRKADALLVEEQLQKQQDEMKDPHVVDDQPTTKQDDTIDRSVKVRWIKEGDGLDIDDTVLTEMFPAGEVENVVLLKDKRRKVDGREKKVVLGTAVIVFAKLSSAKRAVGNGPVDELQSVEWANGKGDD